MYKIRYNNQQQWFFLAAALYCGLFSHAEPAVRPLTKARVKHIRRDSLDSAGRPRKRLACNVGRQDAPVSASTGDLAVGTASVSTGSTGTTETVTTETKNPIVHAPAQHERGVSVAGSTDVVSASISSGDSKRAVPIPDEGIDFEAITTDTSYPDFQACCRELEKVAKEIKEPATLLDALSANWMRWIDGSAHGSIAYMIQFLDKAPAIEQDDVRNAIKHLIARIKPKRLLICDIEDCFKLLVILAHDKTFACAQALSEFKKMLTFSESISVIDKILYSDILYDDQRVSAPSLAEILPLLLDKADILVCYGIKLCDAVSIARMFRIAHKYDDDRVMEILSKYSVSIQRPVM